MGARLTFDALPDAWWPYLFILLAAIAPTEIWRSIGVLAAGRLDEAAPAFALVRAIATALVAAVIAKLIVSPDGARGEVPVAARLLAAAIGFASMELAGGRMWVGIVLGELALLAAILVLSRGAKPPAVMLSYDEYRSWQETLHLLSSAKNARRLDAAVADYRAGKARERTLIEPDG